jgi:hypothetical protein
MSSCFLFTNDEEANNKINIDELYEKKRLRDLKQLSLFNKILNRVQKRIQTIGKRGNAFFLWFQIPDFLFGESLYDSAHCTAYIVAKLEENGFSVQYYQPNTLYISWEHWVPGYVRTEIKKKTGIVVNERGQIVPKKEPGDQTTTTTEKTPATTATTTSDSKYQSIKKYKPTGNLVYDSQLFESIEKKVSS